jgi:hypothetical protein
MVCWDALTSFLFEVSRVCLGVGIEHKGYGPNIHQPREVKLK